MTDLSTCTGTACHSPARKPGLLQMLGLMMTARRQRRDLRNLPPQILKDLGLSDEDVQKEAMRRFWDVPSHWLR